MPADQPYRLRRTTLRRASATPVAAAAAVALTAGLTTPHPAQADQPGGAAQSARSATPHHRIQLITSDRVVVDA
jgi:hypothetical protein